MHSHILLRRGGHITLASRGYAGAILCFHKNKTRRMSSVIQSSVSMWEGIKDKPKIVFTVHWRRNVNTVNTQLMRALVSITLQGHSILLFMSIRGRIQRHWTSQAGTLNIVPTPGIVDLPLITMKIIVTHQSVFVTLASHHPSCVGFYRHPLRECGMVLNSCPL